MTWTTRPCPAGVHRVPTARSGGMDVPHLGFHGAAFGCGGRCVRACRPQLVGGAKFRTPLPRSGQDASAHHLLCGLAANPSLPDIDRGRRQRHEPRRSRGLSRAQALALAERVGQIAVQLTDEGWLAAADIDPSVWPDDALALLDQGADRPPWARQFAADPVRARREKPTACPGLPSDVVDTLAADPEVHVVAELALWTTPACCLPVPDDVGQPDDRGQQCEACVCEKALLPARTRSLRDRPHHDRRSHVRPV
ncbi:hypothetical protein ACFV0T_22225 [Streptomyces sp. NPDC059582]|uniref:hypothetical protein n=1 Tax=Streptomyces sp. NPDC059582 TaxID=3346875 RepID=UPI0036CF1F4A